MGQTKEALKQVQTSAELLSYIINVTPELKEEIDLPKQGESILPIGKIIMNNTRYKNAFLNTCNLIGLTVIKRNIWRNPWSFVNRGSLPYGQQIREVINDLAKVYDYNDLVKESATHFLENEVPNVLNYMHEVNFQKTYKTTTSDSQIAMAFQNDDLFSLVDAIVGSLYESLEYDTYIVNKYMLCRRALDGTITARQLTGADMREMVAEMKEVSDDMTFRSPDFNPAGLRLACAFDDQRIILNTKSEARISTEVLATSYFKDQADMKIKSELIDGYDRHDEDRLKELLGAAYIPFTPSEKETLKTAVATIVSDKWFMNYNYALDNAEGTASRTFENPEKLMTNHYLHCWKVISTSPFEPAVIFTTATPSVSGVTLSPSNATVKKGQKLQLAVEVTATGFANKAVTYEVNSTKSKINSKGELIVASDEEKPSLTVTAKSVYNNKITGTATITVEA